jgi:nitronate monooxygenase
MTATKLLELLDIDAPIIQAPMAGVSTPEMAAAVSNAGALGSIGVGATDAPGAQQMMAAFRKHSPRSLNVNVFCHAPARADAAREANWIERLRPEFARLDAKPPTVLREIYRSFVEDDAMLAVLVAERPKVVSFHFGIPSRDRINALRDAGIVLLGSATSLTEARAHALAGVDAVIAQGYEAGGHRGVFDPNADDDCLGTLALTRLLVREMDRPVIAAGGLMDGAGVAAALRLGAGAAQLGTAFIACDESQADAGYRAALGSERRAPYGDDPRDLRPSRASPGQSLHRARPKRPRGRRARLSDRVRRSKGSARGRQRHGRVRFRRAVGGPRRAAFTTDARRRSRGTLTTRDSRRVEP